jgi:alkylation response protein AidB-like acyl-CoA dehydrogenase
MRYKVSFLAGFSAGFVVGARAGRERYEQLRKLARRTADNPAVQQAAAAMQAKAAGLASTATHKVAGQLHDGIASARDKVPGMRSRESNGQADQDSHFAEAPGARSPADGADS